jgi:hypothetical protein
MKRPDDLIIKLHHHNASYHEEDGYGYIVTGVGIDLYKLSHMWGMTYEEVVAKLANAAVECEEEFIMDGEYIPEHRRNISAYKNQPSALGGREISN